MARRGAAGGRSLLTIADFTGGLNTRVSRFKIKDSQAVEVKNFFFGIGGILKVRPGSDRVTTSSLGASKILGGVRYYPATGSPQLLVDHGTSWYKSTDDGVTFSALTLPITLSAFEFPHYVQTQDLAFRVDGVNAGLKYNGTTVTRWGITGPSTAGTGAETTGGSLTATSVYKWKVTFVSATAESNGSATEGTFTLTGANNKINLSSIPVSTDTQVTARRIYRTKAGGAIYYFERQINDNVTTTSELSLADSALGSEMPEDKDVPPVMAFAELFKNRIFYVPASNLRQVGFTELFEPEAAPLDFAVNIPFPEGDKITGLKARGDLLFIYGTASVFVIVGDSPFNFTVRQTFADEGFVSQRGVVEVENVAMGPSRFGFQAFDGANARVLSIEIEPSLRSEVDLDRLDEICGVYDIENRLVRWTVPTTGGGAKEYIFDLFRRSWTTSDRAASVYIPFIGAPDQGELYTGDTTAGYVWKENVGWDDNGVAINARFRTKTFDFGSTRFMKRLWHVFIDHKPAASGTLAVEVIGDSGIDRETFSPPLASSIILYGDSTKKYGDNTRLYGGTLYTVYDEGFTFDPDVPKDFVVRHAEVLIDWTGTVEFELYMVDIEHETEQWLRKS